MDSLNLYTVVVDYRGGTYVSQARASSVASGIDKCLRNWISNIGNDIIDATHIEEIIDSFQQDEPALLEGLSNVWCSASNVLGEVMMLNVVRTHEQT